MRMFWYLLGAVVASGSVMTQIAWAQHCSAPKNQLFYSSGTSDVPLVGGIKQAKVLSILCSNTDPSNSYNLQFSIVRDSVTYPLVMINIPASAGTAPGKPAKAVVTSGSIPGLPSDAERNPYLILDFSDTLQMATDNGVANG